MICEKCGNEISPGENFCAMCGCTVVHEEAQSVPEPLQPADDAPRPEAVLTQPGEPVPYAEPGTVPLGQAPIMPVKSHMTAAILTTIFFANWILGIPAIVFARECELAAERGQLEIAQRFSRRALNFLVIGSALSFALAAFLGLVFFVVSSVSGGFLY